MLVLGLLNTLKSELAQVAGELALSEAEQILQYVFHRSRSDLYLSSKELISNEKQNEIDVIVQRRKLHEPLPYIFNKAFFHSMEFFVDRNVLIPRPDTEILVETILNSEKTTNCFFLDLGIGSGAISAILAKQHPPWRGIGTDISIAALHIATMNCPTNVFPLNADALSAFKPGHYFDFIVSNPPYVSAKEMNELDDSVIKYEPETALYGGRDGLDFYRILSEKAKDILKPEGRLYCEIGYGQGETAKELLATQGWRDIRVLSDLAGRPRVCVCRV